MRITVQVVIENDDERPPERHDVARLDRGDLDAGTVGCSSPRPNSYSRACRK
jgi:hypothetical protein